MNLQLMTLTLTAILIGGISAVPADNAAQECGGAVVYQCTHTHTDEDDNKIIIRCEVYAGLGPDHITKHAPSGTEINNQCIHTTSLPDGGR